MDSNITLQTKQMIDSLKAVCTNFGLGNASSEYKIITEVFLYKFLNDKFLFEAKRVEPALAKLSPADAEKQLAQMTDDDYELFLLGFDPDTAKLKQTHFISYLFNRKNEENFHMLFDDTLLDIATYNIDIFSVRTGGQSKMRLFSGISQHVIEAEKKDDFCRAIIDKIAECSFDSVFEQKYDFFAQIFEYLIKDYNKDFGKYAEYYTPHSIASIIAKIMVPNGAKNVTVYDPAAGSGTLVLALAHEIGESNCTIYTQDISQKSNEFLRLNLILNNLVHSLPNVVHDDTLLRPYHKNAKGDGLATFDYIVSNPPFNMDFSDSRDTLAGDNHKKRFFAGVPSIPKKDIEKMAVYGHRMTAPCPETKYIPYRNYSDPNICLRYYVTSDFLYLLLRFLEYHIGNANGNEAQYATRRLLDVVLLFDSNEDAEDFATYIHRHLGTFDSKVLEQREPYIANETDMAAKALAQEIRNSQALKEMQPEWELFRLENA
jgi:type I restriction enzyme M protein